jgi:RNA polymerase sigma-70 factor (ECF subfamily)
MANDDPMRIFRRRAWRFESRIRKRNRTEYISAAVVSGCVHLLPLHGAKLRSRFGGEGRRKARNGIAPVAHQRASHGSGGCKKVGIGVTTLSVKGTQDEQYREAAGLYGAALERLARAYEADADWRRDLLQEIHLALWRSFEGWDGRCSLRTWVYRVVHNAATSHAMRQRRRNSRVLMSLEELDASPDGVCSGAEAAAGQRAALERLLALVQQLKPADRQVILSYLEGMDAVSIGEITGLAPGNVTTKIHRIKRLLSRRFHEGGRHGE